MPLVRAAALKAVGLDENNAEAHAMLAVVAVTFDYDGRKRCGNPRLRIPRTRYPAPLA